MVKSVTATLAVSVALCVLSEAEDFCGVAPNAPLRAAWEQMRHADEVTKAVYQLRYARLLKMDQPPASTERPSTDRPARSSPKKNTRASRDAAA